MYVRPPQPVRVGEVHGGEEPGPPEDGAGSGCLGPPRCGSRIHPHAGQTRPPEASAWSARSGPQISPWGDRSLASLCLTLKSEGRLDTAPVFLFSYTEIEFPYHETSPAGAGGSVVFSLFPGLCGRHHGLSPEQARHPHPAPPSLGQRVPPSVCRGLSVVDADAALRRALSGAPLILAEWDLGLHPRGSTYQNVISS